MSITSKTEQRQAIQKKLLYLSPSLVQHWSSQITSRALELTELAESRSIFLYSSLHREPQTAALIDACLARGKRVALPSTPKDSPDLLWHWISERSQVKPGRHGILEPDPALCEPAKEPEANLIFVPGIAFDSSLHRMGRGGGHYDRALAKVRQETCRVGLFFSIQKLPSLTTEAHDQRLHLVITEQRIWR